MKKTLAIIPFAFALIFFASNMAKAQDMNIYKMLYEPQIKYHNSLKTCTKGTFPLGGKMQGGTVFYVYGNQNGKCHIREQIGTWDMTCYLPLDVAKKYGEEKAKALRDSMRKVMSSSSYVNEVINNKNYCKSKG